MEETEIKLKYEDRKKVISKLKILGSKFREKFVLEDTYFAQGHTDMSNVNDLLRIRKKNANAELTYKGKCKDKKNVWHRVELSTDIKDPKVFAEILANLKFNKISENNSNREVWTLNKLELVFIDFTHPKKLSLLELEGPEEEIHSLVKQLEDVTVPVGEEQFKSFDAIEKYL